MKGKLTPAQAPDLSAATSYGRPPAASADKTPRDNFVILPLPYRSADHVRRTLKLDKNQPGDIRLADALPLLSAHVGAGNGNEALNVFRQCFHAREQRQLGFYVLLAAAGVNLDSQNADVLAEHLDEPLAQYLALHSSPVLRKHASQWAVGSVSWNEGILKHLSQTHALYQRWQDDKVTKSDRAIAERQKALAYVRQHKDSAFGFAMLCLLQDRAGEDKDFHRELAEAWRLFEEPTGLSYVARYEAARSLYRADDKEAARKAFVQLYRDTFKLGMLSPIDSDFRWAMTGTGPDNWTSLMRQTADQLVKDKRRPAVLALAKLCWRLEDEPLANTLLGVALDGITDAKEKLALTLAGIGFLEETSQIAAADDRLRALAEGDKDLAKKPGLWRMAVRFADGRDMPDRALEALERALAMEFANLPEVVDLKSVREDYARLLNQYDKLAEAMLTLKIKPGPEFLAKVVRAADRWRALDQGSADPATRAAAILHRLGERELSWDYLTTPVALKPNEADAWVSMATALVRKGDLSLADRAYQSACDTEPTNAQLLWDRAHNLRRAGKDALAREVFRRIAEGTWQPRFQGLAQQARGELER